MRIGLGLPNSAISLKDGSALLETVRRAEAAGFSTLATIGRVAYPTFEELVALSAAAAATSRVQLFTDILLAATREPVLLAKQAATLDQLSGGRFLLGIGVGMREDDFTVTGMGYRDRGDRLDAALELMHRAWAGEPVAGSPLPVTPTPTNGKNVPVMIGGYSDRALARVARYGVGYTQGGGTPDALKDVMERVKSVWQRAGREGKPEFRALAYFALGDDAQQAAEHDLRSYYGAYGERVWQGAARDANAIRARVDAYQALGTDELIFFMAAPVVEQVERLAEIVF